MNSSSQRSMACLNHGCHLRQLCIKTEAIKQHAYGQPRQSAYVTSLWSQRTAACCPDLSLRCRLSMHPGIGYSTLCSGMQARANPNAKLTAGKPPFNHTDGIEIQCLHQTRPSAYRHTRLIRGSWDHHDANRVACRRLQICGNLSRASPAQARARNVVKQT